jgi:diguanylate cyclase
MIEQPPPNWIDTDRYKQELVIDKIRLLYQESGYALVASVVAGLIWSVAVWDFASKSRLAIWVAALCIATILRLAMFFSFRKHQPAGAEILEWYTPYAISLGISSLIWGASVWVVYDAEPIAQVITYSFAIGLAGAAIVAYGLFLRLAVIAIVCVLIPIVMHFSFDGKNLTAWLAVAGLWFFLTTLRSARVYNRRLDESFRQTYLLQEAKRVADWHAETDVLTGLKNRRAFTNAADTLIQISMREGRDDSMMLIDIDQFKEINDNFGHAVGDQVLQHVAVVLQSTLRRSDICGRIGGDEFSVLLPNTSAASAREVAEKIRLELNQKPISAQHTIPDISLSIGLASNALQGFDELLKRADHAMYEAKRRGKNQVISESIFTSEH